MTTTILVPIDFSDCCDNVLAAAANDAAAHSARLVLMHSIAVPEGLSANAPVSIDGSVPQPALQHLRREAQERLARHAESISQRGIEVEQLVTEGATAQQILDVAADQRADRIIMGTRDKRGLARVVLGSVAQEVKSKAPCPVTVVASHWSSSCAARSCHWCASGRTDVERQLDAELDG